MYGEKFAFQSRLEGRFNGRFFCVTSLGGFYLEGLIHGGAYFRNFTLFLHVNSKLGLQHPRVPLAANIGPFMNLL